MIKWWAALPEPQKKRMNQTSIVKERGIKDKRPGQSVNDDVITAEGTWPVQQIITLLEPLYGPAKAPRRYDAISELVYTILSQNTSDVNSIRAYRNLLISFQSWDALAIASVEEVADAIKIGGLAQVKAPRIQGVLREVKKSVGSFDLSFLAEIPLEEAQAWLRRLPGVGPKTVGCVLLFALDRPVLPVDTHVYRVTRRLGLFDNKVSIEASHEVLKAMLIPSDVLSFHMYLITHGRSVCKAQRPLCNDCVLEKRCPSSTLPQYARDSAEVDGRSNWSTAAGRLT